MGRSNIAELKWMIAVEIGNLGSIQALAAAGKEIGPAFKKSFLESRDALGMLEKDARGILNAFSRNNFSDKIMGKIDRFKANLSSPALVSQIGSDDKEQERYKVLAHSLELMTNRAKQRKEVQKLPSDDPSFVDQAAFSREASRYRQQQVDRHFQEKASQETRELRVRQYAEVPHEHHVDYSVLDRAGAKMQHDRSKVDAQMAIEYDRHEQIQRANKTESISLSEKKEAQRRTADSQIASYYGKEDADRNASYEREQREAAAKYKLDHQAKLEARKAITAEKFLTAVSQDAPTQFQQQLKTLDTSKLKDMEYHFRSLNNTINSASGNLRNFSSQIKDIRGELGPRLVRERVGQLSNNSQDFYANQRATNQARQAPANERRRQMFADEQANTDAINARRTQLGQQSEDFYARQRATNQSRQQVAQDHYSGAPPTTERKMAYMRERAMPGDTSFVRNLKDMDDEKLKKVRTHFEKLDKVAKANPDLNRNYDAQINAIDREQKRVGDDGKRVRSGKRSDMRAMRWQAMNVGYGVEDASIGYQLNGVQGAVRGGLNNVTALAQNIKSPMMAAGAVIGMTAVGMLAPALIEYITQIKEGKALTEEFTHSLNKMYETSQKEFKLKKLINKGDFDDAKAALEGNEDASEVNKLDTDKLQNKLNETKRKRLTLEKKYGEDNPVTMGLTGAEFFNEESLSGAGRGTRAAMYDKRVAKDREEYLRLKKEGETYESELREKGVDATGLKADRPKIAALTERKKYEDDANKAMAEFYRKTEQEEKLRDKVFTPAEMKVKADQFIDKTTKGMMDKRATPMPLTDALSSEEEEMRLRKDMADRFRKGFGKRLGKDGETRDFDVKYEESQKARQKLAHDKTEAVNLRSQLLGVVDPTKQIQEKFNRQNKDIFDNSALSQKDKADMNVLNEKARQKALKENQDHLHPKEWKPVNEGIDVGSRADAELKQRLGGASPQSEANDRQKILEIAQAIEGHLKGINQRTTTNNNPKPATRRV